MRGAIAAGHHQYFQCEQEFAGGSSVILSATPRSTPPKATIS